MPCMLHPQHYSLLTSFVADRFPHRCYSNAADTEAAEGLRLHALAFVAQQSHGRIWQQQRFVLHNGSKERAPWWGRQQPSERQCVWGSGAFGDNVEDEWFIVWLLLRLTELHTGIIARQARRA